MDNKISELEDRVQLIDLVSWGQRDIVEKLIHRLDSKLNLDEKDSNGNFAAIVAAARNDLPMLKILVENGARLDLKDGRGRTVRGWAEKYKNTAMLDYIDEKTKAYSKSLDPARNSMT